VRLRKHGSAKILPILNEVGDEQQRVQRVLPLTDFLTQVVSFFNRKLRGSTTGRSGLGISATLMGGGY